MDQTPKMPRLAGTVVRFIVATLALVAVLVPGAAQAQDAPALASLSTVLAVHGAGQSDTLIVFAEAPQGTPLPAKISVRRSQRREARLGRRDRRYRPVEGPHRAVHHRRRARTSTSPPSR